MTTYTVADLRRLRAASGLTQREFSARLGMSEKGYQYLERGPDISLLQRQVLALESLSLELAVERGDINLVVPLMRARIKRFERLEKRERIL